MTATERVETSEANDLDAVLGPLRAGLRDARTPGFVVERLADGTGLLMEVESLEVFALNRTALFLVDAIVEEPQGVDGLAVRLADEFGLTVREARQDVVEFLRSLLDRRSRNAWTSEGARDRAS